MSVKVTIVKGPITAQDIKDHVKSILDRCTVIHLTGTAGCSDAFEPTVIHNAWLQSISKRARILTIKTFPSYKSNRPGKKHREYIVPRWSLWVYGCLRLAIGTDENADNTPYYIKFLRYLHKHEDDIKAFEVMERLSGYAFACQELCDLFKGFCKGLDLQPVSGE